MLRKWGTGCCLAVMITVILALYLADGGSVQASHTQQQAPDLTFEHVVEDLAWLYAVIDPIRASGLRVVASSYDVIELHDGVRPTNIVSRILKPFEGQSLNVQEDEASAMAVVTLPDDSTMSISVQTLSKDEAIIVAKLEVSQMDDIESESAVLGWWSQLDEGWVAELGKRPEWRINLQADLASNHHPHDVWEELEEANASAVDEAGHYHDNGSVSRVFHAPWLHHTVMIQDNEVQLQAALHRSSEDQTYRITLGTPLITIEY